MSPSSHVMLCLLHKTPMKCQTILLEYISADFVETTCTEARFIRDLTIPRNRCTGTGSVPVHVKCSYA